MPKLKLAFAGWLFCLLGCVHHLVTPDEPRALLTNDEGKMRSHCQLLGIFEEVGESEEQARALLSIHVRELGATHLLPTSARALKKATTFGETVRNDTMFAPVFNNVVATGKGYRCPQF